MTDLLEPAIIGILVIVLATAFGRSVGIAGPLLLVAAGLGASFLLPAFAVPPEVILVGVLPPLLYASAVRLPAIEFRRDLGPIGGLAVLLVVGSSLLLGLFFWWAIPGLDFALAVALGAILSPTDAVATSIAKRLGIAPRIITMLEGESLLNDATALVLLRSAVAAVAAGFSFWGTVGTFVWGVVIAVIFGVIVGLVSLRVRHWIAHPAANTALGFCIPFLAYLPTEHFGGSGLVAAVVAGITTGQGATRWVTPEQRVSDGLTWRTIELVLEGAVFLIMGLELRDIVTATAGGYGGPLTALWLALAALAIIVAARAAFVSVLVWVQGRRARRLDRNRWERVGRRLDDGDLPEWKNHAWKKTDDAHSARRLQRMRHGVTRALNDIDYYQSSELGWKHGTVIVWGGMRGVVTLAAAQTLPEDTPSRELLILVAFLVAVISLLVQGLTLPALITRLAIPDASAEHSSAERGRLRAAMKSAAVAKLSDPSLVSADGTPFDPEMLARVEARYATPPDGTTQLLGDLGQLRIALIEAMRAEVNRAGHGGEYSSATLQQAHAELDAEQISLQLRLDGGDDE